MKDEKKLWREFFENILIKTYMNDKIDKNEEIFDWKKAVIYWSQGKSVQIQLHHWRDWENLENTGSGFSHVRFFSDAKYRIRPEPVQPVKWARAMWQGKDDTCWEGTVRLYKSLEHAREEIGSDTRIIWPARFDSEGYLIVPPEFQYVE